MDKKKYLIIKGTTGLGNRLIAISNAIDFARKTKRILIVDWADGMFGFKGVNAFPLFFMLENVKSASSVLDIKVIENKSSYPPIWKDNPEKSVWDLYRLGVTTSLNRGIFWKAFRKIIPRGQFRKLQRNWYLYSGKEKRKKVSHTLFHAIGTLFSKNDFCVGGDLSFGLKEDLVFFVDYCPSFDSKILKSCIRLRPSIENKINQFSERHELLENCIGIHIRMTDAKPNRNINQLYQQIQKIPLTNPKIFLATDSIFAKEYVKKEYPKLIMIPKLDIVPPKGMGRHYYAQRCGHESKAESIYSESVMDMFLLSKCEYLIAQKNSSFSKVSAIFKDKPSKVYYW